MNWPSKFIGDDLGIRWIRQFTNVWVLSMLLRCLNSTGVASLIAYQFFIGWENGDTKESSGIYVMILWHKQILFCFRKDSITKKRIIQNSASFLKDSLTKNNHREKFKVLGITLQSMHRKSVSYANRRSFPTTIFSVLPCRSYYFFSLAWNSSTRSMSITFTILRRCQKSSHECCALFLNMSSRYVLIKAALGILQPDALFLDCRLDGSTLRVQFCGWPCRIQECLDWIFR